MVAYKHGTKSIQYGTETSIVDIHINSDLTIHIFAGSLSPNDILIKYKDGRNRLRTPKHIHWTVDLLIKKEFNPKLLEKLLEEFINRWENISPLNSRNFNSIVNSLVISRDPNKILQFSELGAHGYYSVEFLFHLMELLMIQEKTNNPNAYMFIKIINSIKENRDLYTILSTATHRGK
jgi:hypothetical protein